MDAGRVEATGGRLLSAEEERSLLVEMSLVGYNREGFILRCPVCRGTGEFEDRNVAHSESCWRQRAKEILLYGDPPKGL